MLAGPALGGLLIGVMGATSVLLIDAATYVVSLLLVTLFVPQRPPVAQDEASRGLRVGFGFIARDRLMRIWWPAFALGDAAWTAFFITIPVLVLARYGHHAWIAGWLVASFGVGALIGNAISYRYLARRFDGLLIVTVFVMGQAAPLWLLSLKLPAAVMSVLIASSGIANGLVNPTLHTIMTLRIPPQLRPTVLTTAMVGWAVVNPLALFIVGPVLDAFGTTPVLVGFAAMQTLMMAVVAVTAARERGRLELGPVRVAA